MNIKNQPTLAEILARLLLTTVFYCDKCNTGPYTLITTSFPEDCPSAMYNPKWKKYRYKRTKKNAK